MSALQPVLSERLGKVAVLQLNNPPVNGLGSHVRAALFEALSRDIASSEVSAIAILGHGRVFSAGADIRQFDTPAVHERPLTRDILALVAGSLKPVVAAIHGVAYGGGLELALGCHYRVADAAAAVALPEVRLGLIPGGGGTQRLPRIVGAQRALELILQASVLTAPEAHALGLLDRLAAGDLGAEAVAFAAEMADRPEPHLLVGQRPRPQAIDFAALRTALDPRSPNIEALHEAVNCVEIACTCDLEQGLSEERRRFETLMAGATSRALRQKFFAERQTARQPTPPAKPA